MQKEVRNCSVSESLISDISKLMFQTLQTHVFANILALGYRELYRDVPKEYMLALSGLLYVNTYLIKCLDTVKTE